MTLARRNFMTGMVVALGAPAALSSRMTNAATPRDGSANYADRVRPLSADMLEDALVGSSYLGCGGGGGLSEARALIAADLAAGLEFQAMDADDLDDDDRVACPYALASLAPLGPEMQARLDAVEHRIEAPPLAAFTLLEEHMETRFAGVILGEIGPLSMAEGLSIAARLGVPALDADTVGRATPEINQHSVRVAGHPLTPAAGVTPFGDRVILQDLQDPSRGEDIFRALSVISGLIGVADAPISGAIAKSDNALVKNSLSLAIAIGRAVRMARAGGQDPIAAARAAGDGYSLFEGRVDRFEWADRDGFLIGDVTLTGTGSYSGRRLILDYKNEHLVARLDGAIIATCPDLITAIDAETQEGVSNPDFTEGQRLTILGFRCAPIWRTPAGLAVFSPRYFGYDADYIPIERRVHAV